MYDFKEIESEKYISLENTHPRIAKSELESMQKKQCLKCIKWIQISPHKFMCDICKNIFHT